MSTIEQVELNVLEKVERFNKAKMTGALQPNELSEIINELTRYLSNGLKRGLITEEEADNYLTQIPEKNLFSFKHEGLEECSKIAQQEINVAMYEKESRESVAIPNDNSLRLRIRA